MRNLWLLSVLCGSLAWAQANPAANKTDDAKGNPPSASAVAPNAVVMTVKGLCATPPPAGQPCETVVTRAQFEKLVDAIQPSMDQQSKNQLGKAYPQFLILAKEAQLRGLDKMPRFEERISFARLQILSQELTRQIQDQAAQVSDKDIADYYQAHARDFETANLERIIIPLRSENNKLSADAITKEAETLRARAAAGEDFIKLQKEVYEAVGVSGDTSPNPSLRDMRRRSLPLTHASVFDLKPGEVSPVIGDATGHYIYKMDSKGMVVLESAHREIWNVLRQERARKMMESVQQPFSIDVNHAYFGAEKSGDKD